VKVSQVWNEKKARKWMWLGLAAFVALQIYFVQEMLAALFLFTGVFVLFAIVALVLYVIDRAGQRGLGWAGHQARRGLTLAEDISKKQIRRPRSETAQ
jgi:cytosine/uracil/thiamine/allantoin permease